MSRNQSLLLKEVSTKVLIRLLLKLIGARSPNYRPPILEEERWQNLEFSNAKLYIHHSEKITLV